MVPLYPRLLNRMQKSFGAFLPIDPVCAVCNMTCFDPYPSVLYGYFILYIGVNNIVNICMHRNTYLPFLDIVLVSLNSNI